MIMLLSAHLQTDIPSVETGLQFFMTVNNNDERHAASWASSEIYSLFWN